MLFLLNDGTEDQASYLIHRHLILTDIMSITELIRTFNVQCEITLLNTNAVMEKHKKTICNKQNLSNCK